MPTTTTDILVIESPMPCLVHGVRHLVTCPRDGYYLWRDGGMHIQQAMPDLPRERRETLISGTCPEAWNLLFPEED